MGQETGDMLQELLKYYHSNKMENLTILKIFREKFLKSIVLLLVIFQFTPGLLFSATVSRVGVAVSNTSTANTGSITFNASSTSQLIVVGVNGIQSTANFFTTNNLLINGSAASIGPDFDGTTGLPYCVMFYFVATTTGNHVIQWDWGGTSTAQEGVVMSVAAYTGVNTSNPIGNTGGQQDSDNNFTTGSLSASTGDMIVAHAGVFGTASAASWNNATEVLDVFFNSEAGALAEASPTGATTVSADGIGSGRDGTGCIGGMVINHSTSFSGPYIKFRGKVNIRGIVKFR